VSVSETQLYASLLLIRASGVQPRVCHRLLALFGDARAACHQFLAAQHGATCGLKYAAALVLQKRLRDPSLQQWVDHDLAWLSLPGHCFIGLGSAAYPPLLREIDDPPIGLFCAGNLSIFRAPKLAVVGSRHPTRYGQAVVQRLVGQLADLGLAITSGMALGIDGLAHEASLARGGATIAVLGTSPDQVYPPQHVRLHAQIQEHGLIISEFPPGTTAASRHFPQRNRLVTGLSLGTLVIEARLKSGSLISARLSMEQGREVFAVPGSVLSKLSEGCHQLLRDGAKLTAHVADILEELPLDPQSLCGQAVCAQDSMACSEPLTPEQVRLLEVLDLEPQSPDRLAELLQVSARELMGALVELELLGLAQLGVDGYRLNQRWP